MSWFMYIRMYVYFISHMHFFCIWFRYFRCRANCRKSVQSAARRSFPIGVQCGCCCPRCHDATIPIPIGHWLVEHLALSLSLCLSLPNALCIHSYWSHRCASACFLLELTKIAVPIVYIGAHTAHMAECSVLQLPRMCVCVRLCACVCMVTTGSRAVNVCTSSITNKALPFSLHFNTVSLSLVRPLSQWILDLSGSALRVLFCFCYICFVSIDAAADKQHVRQMDNGARKGKDTSTERPLTPPPPQATSSHTCCSCCCRCWPRQLYNYSYCRRRVQTAQCQQKTQMVKQKKVLRIVVQVEKVGGIHGSGTLVAALLLPYTLHFSVNHLFWYRNRKKFILQICK